MASLFVIKRYKPITKKGDRIQKTENLTALQAQHLIVAQYIDSHLNVTETCLANPNSSVLGITVIYNVDGRIIAIMSHLERVFRAMSNSWYPEDCSEDGAWMRIFRNMRVNFK